MAQFEFRVELDVLITVDDSTTEEQAKEIMLNELGATYSIKLELSKKLEEMDVYDYQIVSC